MAVRFGLHFGGNRQIGRVVEQRRELLPPGLPLNNAFSLLPPVGNFFFQPGLLLVDHLQLVVADAIGQIGQMGRGGRLGKRGIAPGLFGELG